jgi:hypothetical protein
MKRDRRATPARPARQVRGHIVERGLGPGTSALGQPGEKRTKRTAMILECREREAALVMQCAQQILDGDIVRHCRTRGSRYTVVAMRGPVPGSVLSWNIIGPP